MFEPVQMGIDHHVAVHYSKNYWISSIVMGRRDNKNRIGIEELAFPAGRDIKNVGSRA
jgi:hypothetical protein